MRAALCDKLASLGMKLDEQANAAHGPRISAAYQSGSFTNEGRMIAQHTLVLVRP